MSTPPFVRLPEGARGVRLVTARGEFAAQQAVPVGAVRGTALLVPGYTGSKEDFIALLGPLRAAGFRVVTYDQRGQFETSGPEDDERPYRLAELGSDLLAVADVVGGPVHVLGHSFGGFVVREATLAAPWAAPWASVTLMSTGPGAIAPDEAAKTTLLLDALAGMDLESIWQVMQAMAVEDAGTAGPPRLGPGVADFIHRRWLANVPTALTVMGRQLMAEADRVGALAAVLAERGTPVQVVSGDSDYVWPVPEQEEMAARLGAGYVRVEGAGHSPNAERPAGTAAALADFWGKAGEGPEPRRPVG